MIIEFKLKPIREDTGDLMLLEDFIEQCMMGGFTDYDGYGYLSTKLLESNVQVRPSDFVQWSINEAYFELPFIAQKPELKYILWYNR